ncbi:MAG: cell division protein FtsA [Deltaproteobacteria bacterium]|jgi:cell division protein FtsA|nr:cell division protein FtsA [Deltaproteobacteria bacterium]
MSNNDIVVGLDIGTTKVCVLVAEPNEDGGIDIRGMGTAPSTGMHKGMVTNVDRTVAAIRQAKEEAQRIAGVRINSAYVGVAGGHVNSFNTIGMVGVENRTITARDIERVKATALVMSPPVDREILHTITQEYTVDDMSGILDPPIGLSGSRLEVQVHVITGAVNAVHNVINCALKADIEVDDIILESVASAESVLTPEERQMGVAILDSGGGTTDIAVYAGGRIRHTAVLAMGGNHLNSDLAQGLHVSMDFAEKLKIDYGFCDPILAPYDDDIIIVPSFNGSAAEQGLRRSLICNFLSARVEEILEFINSEFIRSGCDEQINEIVLTGGSSLLPGFADLSRRIIARPTRLGRPGSNVSGLTEIVRDPRYATAVGLCLFSLRQDDPGTPKSMGSKKGRDKSIFTWIRDRLSSFFKN